MVVESSESMAESIFPGLSTLLFNEIVTVTSQSLLGVLVSNEESLDHLCSIIPLSELGPMCERALSYTEMKVLVLASGSRFNACIGFFTNMSLFFAQCSSI